MEGADGKDFSESNIETRRHHSICDEKLEEKSTSIKSIDENVDSCVIDEEEGQLGNLVTNNFYTWKICDIISKIKITEGADQDCNSLPFFFSTQDYYVEFSNFCPYIYLKSPMDHLITYHDVFTGGALHATHNYTDGNLNWRINNFLTKLFATGQAHQSEVFVHSPHNHRYRMVCRLYGEYIAISLVLIHSLDSSIYFPAKKKAEILIYNPSSRFMGLSKRYDIEVPKDWALQHESVVVNVERFMTIEQLRNRFISDDCLDISCRIRYGCFYK